MLYLLQKGADIIRVVLHLDDLANVRLLTHLPLDKAYLWSLVLFSPSSTEHFNSAAHFGCSSFVTEASSVYKHCRVSPGIIAPTVLQDGNFPPNKLRCDETSPFLTLGSGSYANFRLEEAVFMRSTFWALPLFSVSAVSHRTEWGYIVQWLLWQTGHGFTVYLPNNYQQYVHNLSLTAKVISILSQTECPPVFEDCINLLLRRMLSLHLVSDRFVQITEQWLRDLKQIGYVFPAVRRHTDPNCTMPVLWSPILSSATSEKKVVTVANVAHSEKLRKQLCQTHRTKVDHAPFEVAVNLTHPWHQFRRLLLVITFNKAHYEVIPYLELLYRSIFPHILYCTPTPLDTTSILVGYQISYITYTEWPVHRVPGSVSYQCAIQAIRMNFAVDGFLFASDDLLLLPVPLSRLSEDRVWFIPRNEIRIGDLDTLRECRLGMCDFHPRWNWWVDFKSATIEALERMAQLSRSSPLVYNCLAKLHQQNGVGSTQIRVNGAYSDIFHIPLRIAHDFADVAEIFAEYGVFLEIAVPTVLQCIEPPANFQPLPGKDIQVRISNFQFSLCSVKNQKIQFAVCIFL